MKSLETLVTKAMEKCVERGLGDVKHNDWRVVASRTPDEDQTTHLLVYYENRMIANMEPRRGYWLLDCWEAKTKTEVDALNCLAEKFDLTQRFTLNNGEVKEIISL